MKRILLLLAFISVCFTLSLNAQIERHVKWTYEVKSFGENEAEIFFNAKIDDQWHLYSQYTGGTMPLFFSIEDPQGFEPDTVFIELTKPEKHYDEVFEDTTVSWAKTADFKQKIKLIDDTININGFIQYQICIEGKCILEDFGFDIKIVNGSVVNSEKQSNKEIVETDTIGETTEASVKSKDDGKKGLLGVFIAGLLGGLLALLMPCIFPMIPLTVSFFTKKDQSRAKGISQAFIYGISIIIIFVALGLGVTIAFGSDSLNAMASNGIFNMVFFILFIIFAVSFFGAFEITLPNSWINKADQRSEKGGLVGVFFMAFTLVLVSFSCTGPIIGTLLVETAVKGNMMGPFMGMLGFSIALAVPFTLFAIFPAWLNSLPKSGSWLNAVKVSLGFLELALAMKFLSNVDLAYHWGILTREIFLSFWIVIFGLFGAYLLGKIKFPHDSELKHISVPRAIIAIIVLSFTVYLVPGLWGAPVKLTSGLVPPAHYKEWKQNSSAAVSANPVVDTSFAKYMHEGPHNLMVFHDYDRAIEYGKIVGKPIMVDFTGWTCVNCRKMEDNVWIEQSVLDIIRNQYVLAELYVDDKEDLPEEEQYMSDASGRMKKMETYGNKWSDLQAKVYKTNAQPWYILLDHDKNVLVEPLGYTPNIDDYRNFLQKGVEEFKKNQGH